MTDVVHVEAPEGHSELQELGNAMVHLYKEQLGRGPTKARAAYAGPDTIVTVLENTMVPAERTLVHMGQGDRVAETRLMVMRGAEAAFVAAVEQITGRKVRAMVCGMVAEPDISTKVFHLEPQAEATP